MSFVSEVLKRADVVSSMVSLAAAAITWVCAWGARALYIHTKNERVRGILLRLDDAAATAVGDIEQSAVKALKAAAPDGKLSPAVAAAVKDAAVESLRTHLGTKGVAELKTVLGVTDVVAALGFRVEAAVNAASSASVAKP